MNAYVGLERFAAVNVGGISFAATTMQQAVEWLVQLSQTQNAETRGTAVRLANAYCVALASRDPDYSRVLNGPGINFPDGTPVTWFMRATTMGSYHVRSGRVRGPSFFRAVLDASQGTRVKHFFLGTTDDTLEALRAATLNKFPGVALAGAWAPPFAAVDQTLIDDAVTRIRMTGANLVWVGMGTPKQDILAAGLADKLGVPCVGVGAAFDFSAGKVRESPTLLQALGLEWGYRLWTEPRRLWKRYLIGNAVFLLVSLWQFKAAWTSFRHGDVRVR